MLITELYSLGGAADRAGSGPEERLLTDFNLGLMIGVLAPTPCSRKSELTYLNLGDRGYTSVQVVWD